MKYFSLFFVFASLALCQQSEEISVGGKSYFVNPLLAQELGNLPEVQRWERLQRYGSQMQMGQQDLKEISIGGKSYFVNPLLAQQVGTLPAAQQWEQIQRMGFQAMPRVARSWNVPTQNFYNIQAMPRLARSWNVPTQNVYNIQAMPRVARSWNVPTQNVYNKEFTQQRVVRTPISKTVTVLPNEVTRVTRNIKTHMPMVHERVRHHYNVENVNRKNVIHHYVEPVRNARLGTRRGRSSRLGTEHVVHKNRQFNPSRFAAQQGN